MRVRRIVRRVSLVAALAALPLALVAGPASATSIVDPSGSPVTVPATASGDPLPFTIRASGFPPGANVFVEQCDATSPKAVGWDPTLDCDLGSSPAAATADAGGVAQFDAADPNHAFHPFVGASPQGLFNCLAPTGPSPANGLVDSRACQVRVSTNNTVATADQVFVVLRLPNGSAADAGAASSGTAGSGEPEDGTTLPGQLPRTGSTPAPLGGAGTALVIVGLLLTGFTKPEPTARGLSRNVA